MKAGEVGKAAYLGRIASFIPSVSDREGLAGMAAAGYHLRLQAKNNYYFRPGIVIHDRHPSWTIIQPSSRLTGSCP
jgi:hypothetical protein